MGDQEFEPAGAGGQILLGGRDVLPRNVCDGVPDTLIKQFRRQAAAHANRLAIEAESEALTFGELETRSDRLAAHLCASQPSDKRPVGLLMEEGPNLIMAMIAVLKAGRPFVALDAHFSGGWVSQAIAGSGAGCILTDRKTADFARRAAAGVEVIDVGQFDLSRMCYFESSAALPDDPAFIVYTSGSTGRPKGVVVSHRTAIHTPRVRAGLLGLRPSDRIANLRSSGVIAGIHNALLPLLHGACLLPFDLRTRGVHGLTPWLAAREITGITFSGSLLRTWLASLPADLKFPFLRFVIASAEPLYGKDVQELACRLEGDWRIMHTLVSTETGILAASLFGPSDRIEPGLVPVGNVVQGSDVRVEKDDGTLAAPGEPGEIVVRSPYLARSYWKDPEATARAFQTDPDGTRVYCSGDLGRWRADGLLEHLGRKTRKIKIRGFSVEPREVECALLALPGVRDAIVTTSEEASDDIRMIAYAVMDGSRAGDAANSLRAVLTKSLPAHMVPTHVVVLDAFPLNARGKIDRAALPSPSIEKVRAPYRAPSDEYERGLAHIWQFVLRQPRIGVDDDFHEIGGTSLQAFVIFAFIASSFGRDFPVTSILHAPTIARLAELIRESGTTEKQEDKLVTFRSTGAGPALFVVHAACGEILFVHELVRALKTDCPVYGLQPPPLDGKHRIPSTMTALAADYIAEIRKVQPVGPYCLAGYSFGAWAAYEMARQLEASGERVSFVGLIDPRKTRIFVNVRVSNLPKKLFMLLVRSCKRLRQKFVRLQNQLRMANTQPVPYAQRLQFYDSIYRPAVRTYEPALYRGHIVIFSSQGGTERHRERWSLLAQGGVSIVEIPGNHRSMVWPPNSALLAAGFDAHLDGVL